MPALLAAMERVFGFKQPTAHGHTVAEAIEAMLEGKSKAMIALGGNFAVAAPDPALTYPALKRLDLTVNIATKLNRTHLLTGKQAWVLPCLGRTEIDVQPGGRQSVTVEDSMSMVHASRGMRQPASEHLRSEPWIVARMALATFGEDSCVDWRGLGGRPGARPDRAGLPRAVRRLQRPHPHPGRLPPAGADQ
jgi:anaerobic selenocysteine-containing dehydrogenase